MPKYFYSSFLFAALLVFATGCSKEALPKQDFAGTWRTEALGGHGFTLNAADDNSLSGVVYEAVLESPAVPVAFSGGRWELSADNSVLTLDFPASTSFGTRRYQVLGPIDASVVRLQLRQQETLNAPLLELER